jgi:hypothetical protein
MMLSVLATEGPLLPMGTATTDCTGDTRSGYPLALYYNLLDLRPCAVCTSMCVLFFVSNRSRLQGKVSRAPWKVPGRNRIHLTSHVIL